MEKEAKTTKEGVRIEQDLVQTNLHRWCGYRSFSYRGEKVQ
jgi:hypothetical protein